jgi:hypothetical protein
MKNQHILIIITFFQLLFFGCTREADITLPAHQPKLVLHGYMAVGDTFMVSLGRSVQADRFLADTETYVKDAVIYLYENGIVKDTLRYDASVYRYVAARTVAAGGKTYRITAHADGYPDVEATTSAPVPVPGISVARIPHSRTTSAGAMLDDIRFSFQDPPGKDYYYAAVYGTFPAQICVYTYEPSIERYSGDLAPFDQSSCISNEEILFTDKSFDGQQKQIVLSGESIYLEPYTDPSSGTVYNAELRRYHVSEEHYRYIKQSISLGFSSGTPTLNDPVSIKGNVKNGYGLFTIYTVTRDILQ